MVCYGLLWFILPFSLSPIYMYCPIGTNLPCGASVLCNVKTHICRYFGYIESGRFITDTATISRRYVHSRSFLRHVVVCVPVDVVVLLGMGVPLTGMLLTISVYIQSIFSVKVPLNWEEHDARPSHSGGGTGGGDPSPRERPFENGGAPPYVRLTTIRQASRL